MRVVKSYNFSDIEKNAIIGFYTQHKSLSQSAIQFNIPIPTLYGYLKRWQVDTKKDFDDMGRKIRKFEVNEHYFNQIDTREKAYVFGWIHSDGALNDKTSSMQVRLKIADLELLEKINRIFFKKRELYINKKESERHKQCKTMVICSSIMFNDLVNLGCTPRKSCTKIFPILPNEFMCDFIRGYFDGNGSISLAKYGRTIYGEIKIVSSKIFCDGLMNFLKAMNIHSYIDRDNRCDERIANLRIRQQSAIILFFEYIYKELDGQLFLKRKHDKFIKLKTERSGRIS